MNSPQLIPHALWHRDLDIIITLEKLGQTSAETRQAWKEANAEVLYRIEDPDSAQLSFDFDAPAS